MKRIYHKPVPYTQRSRNHWYGLISPDGTAYRSIPDLTFGEKLFHNVG